MIGNGTVKRIGPRLVSSFLIILVFVSAGVQIARAEPRNLTQAKSQAAALEAQLNDLKAQAAVLREKYDSASTRLAQAEAEAAENATLLTQAQKDQLTAEIALSDRLAHIYKQGRGGTLGLVLSSASWSDLLHRVALLQRIGKQDADLVKQVTAYRAQVADRATKLTAQLRRQQAEAGQAEAARQAVAQKLAQTRQLLKGKEAQIAQLEKEWEAQQAKQARLERERQAKLQAALAAAQAAAQETAANDGQNGTGGGSETHHAGVPNVLKPEQIALVAKKAGFSGENLVIAVAVAMTESRSDANAIGRGPVYGLWQIFAHAHPDLIDPSDPDASRWYDPYVNARFAWHISSGGTTWRPWAVYNSGSYQRNMARARAGVDLLLSNPGAITPPSVK